ncbi:hypothetical protein GOODEAATRI_009081 [Goodea atripinnis]|uniref:Uncharacterized protein n=1 Tax=Goodea atripinnis TaxID=208336 RepID=A0ABV0MG97_9TELE
MSHGGFGVRCQEDGELQCRLAQCYSQDPTSGQSCPSGVFRVGTVERGVREHQLLPKRNTLPLPIFTPAELGVRLGRGAPHTEQDLQPFPTPDGICPSKRSVDEITRDLPPVKPTLMEFAKAPKTLGRSMSQEVQRG